jgi:hypothetical protein
LTVKDARANLTQTDNLRLSVLSADEAPTAVSSLGQSLTLPPTITGVLFFVTLVVIVGSAIWLFEVSTKTFRKKRPFK